ncbi:MAG: HlyD family efflux transporter periplasmic adaptor subunit [Planctomycetaceae bacterium]|nr:MAG: HlyD family efflux transporter periplasmic adaptor subunit [Planctomycetaceae bacterium]
MNSLHSRCPRTVPARRRGGALVGVLIALTVVAGLGMGGYWAWQRSLAQANRPDLIVDQVGRGPFDHIVLEQGELESSSNVDVVCQVRARTGNSGTPILWVVDEGTAVKAGDKLVELDDSAWKQALRDKRIVVIGAEAQVAAAEAAVEQAKISRQEYLEGLFETEERAIQSEMALAEQGLRKAQLELQSTERLVARGLVKSLQLEADQFAVANNRNMLHSAENRLRVLQTLTRQKMLVEFDSAIDSAEAQLAAALGSLEEEQTDLRDIQKQIELCTIYAPADGVVIHANVYSSRGGSAEVVIEPGAIIRERQTLIRLPDPRKMQVRAKINESRITLINPGMPAKIRIDAITDMELLGRVVRVNRYAEPGSWFSTSIKEYATIIEIIDPPESIRTGMTAEVQIFVQQLQDVTQVPIQSIYQHGGLTYCLVKKGNGRYETRVVKIGATNDQRATILNGVEDNDTIVLNLRQNLSLLDLPTLDTSVEDLSARLASEGVSALPGPSAAVESGDGGRPEGAVRPEGGRPAGAGRPEGGGRPGVGDRSDSTTGTPPAEATAVNADTQPAEPTESSATETTAELTERAPRQSFLERITAARQGQEEGQSSE